MASNNQFIRETLFELCVKIAIKEKLHAKFKVGFKLFACAGSGATFGAFLGGPIGMAVGGIIGGTLGSLKYMEYDTKNVGDFMKNEMNDTLRDKLINNVIKALEDHFKLEISVILPILLASLPNPARSVIIGVLRDFMIQETDAVSCSTLVVQN